MFGKAKKATKTQQIDRLAICNSCDELFRPTKQCKKCGCFVKAKALYAESFCPVGNWDTIQSDLDKVEQKGETMQEKEYQESPTYTDDGGLSIETNCKKTYFKTKARKMNKIQKASRKANRK